MNDTKSIEIVKPKTATELINKFGEKEIKNKEDVRTALYYIYQALTEKGYNPIAQICGYLLSEDPTYITAHKEARKIAWRLDRDEALRCIVEEYIKKS